MNDQSNDNQAWIWYEPDNLTLRHVSFNETAWEGQHLEKLSMDFQTALDLASGKSRLFEYKLELIDDQLSLVYVKKKPPFKKFWQLLEPDNSISNAIFDDTARASSPITIKGKTLTGLVVDIVGAAKNIELYITMKNDPNYLIDKIELFPYAVKAASVTDIEIPVTVNGDYSVYVRYDAT